MKKEEFSIEGCRMLHVDLVRELLKIADRDFPIEHVIKSDEDIVEEEFRNLFNVWG